MQFQECHFMLSLSPKWVELYSCKAPSIPALRTLWFLRRWFYCEHPKIPGPCQLLVEHWFGFSCLFQSWWTLLLVLFLLWHWGDLSRKLTASLTSQDFEPLPYNCRTGRNGACGYKNMCRNSIAVYKVKCNKTAKVRTLGNAQQKFKARMQQHFNEVQKFVKLGEKLDSYAKRFATQFHNTNPSVANERIGISCSIHLARQPHRCSQNLCDQKLCPVC